MPCSSNDNWYLIGDHYDETVSCDYNWGYVDNYSKLFGQNGAYNYSHCQSSGIVPGTLQCGSGCENLYLYSYNDWTVSDVPGTNMVDREPAGNDGNANSYTVTLDGWSLPSLSWTFSQTTEREDFSVDDNMKLRWHYTGGTMDNSDETEPGSQAITDGGCCGNTYKLMNSLTYGKFYCYQYLSEWISAGVGWNLTY